LQRHALPESEAALDRLARRAGMEPAAARAPREILLETLGQHFERVRAIYERLLSHRLTEEPAAEAAETQTEDVSATRLIRRLEAEFPCVAAEVAKFGDDRDAEAGYARRGLSRYLNSAIHEPATMTNLETHPEWIRAAAELFESSDLAVDLLCRHPEEIALLGEPEKGGGETVRPADAADLRVRVRRETLAAVVSALSDSSGDEKPAGTVRAAETSVKRENLTRPFATFARLTRLAESALCEALRFAAEEVFGAGASDLAAAPFAVVALGRLGTREIDVGSDADLLFLTDDTLPVEERDAWRRMAERFVHIVSSHTRDGVLYPVDTRLRPHGGEGELLPSLGALETYFQNEAAAWEAVTLLKSRPIAGNLALGVRMVAAARRILAARFASPAVLARELANTRERVEKDVAGPRAKGKFKKSRGGYYDLEYVVGFLAFTHGVVAGGGGDAGGRNVLEQIGALRDAKAVDAARFELLHRAALLYRSVDHATRLITGRAIGQSPEPALAERITRLLRQWNIEVSGDLRGEIEETRAKIRALYEETVLAARGE
jgi:glutamate-ammonia-ligase adenylyltransferase